MNDRTGKGIGRDRRGGPLPWGGSLLSGVAFLLHFGAPCALCGSFSATRAPAQQPITVPIGQITRLQGAMPNELEGFGLVTGLDGTGSTDKASSRAAQNLIRKYGLNVNDGDVSTGAYALVMVNATLPPFSKEGQTIDATVSTLSDAKSLYGGQLQEVLLTGPDGEVYAHASGPVSISGFAASSQGTSVVRNHVTKGHVSGGAIVIQAPQSYFLSEEGHLELQLINPSLLTASNIAAAINGALGETGCKARVEDRTLVQIVMPPALQNEDDAIRILQLVRPIPTRVSNPTAVVIDAAAGVILAGEGVMISPCVVALSDLTISVVSEDEVSQPLPGPSLGTTEVVNRTRIDVNATSSELKPVAGGASVNELLGNLKALQLSPRQLIQVFEKLRAGGYLQAELIVR